MNCNEAKKIDIVSFLAKNGINPDYIQGVNHWYKSPFRKEKNPSFKVNSYKNLWFDFGIGEGGDIIKLTNLLFKVDNSNALKILSNNHYPDHQKTGNSKDSKVLITNVKEISNIQLINYIESRRLNIQLAKEYCKEVSFKLNDKNFYAIGFQNDSKGYELRCKYFKGSSTPKDITLIKNNTDKLLLFEGFIDFLSWFSCNLFLTGKHDYLILNTLSFLNKSKSVINGYNEVLLFLDNDKAGKRATDELIGTGLSKCIDMSGEYSEYKDLNESLAKFSSWPR
ncbi:MAG TPA: toprim domain-containing protein [Bacteroidales bacterium]|nr:toprim domain-containing protein [Bacteroidales bacterium]